MFATSWDGNRRRWANRRSCVGQSLFAGEKVVDQPLAALGHEVEQ
jgi:hypothetical protein